MSPLSVALDASLWDEPTTGIGRVSHRLSKALGDEGVHVLRVGAERSGEWPRSGWSKTAFTVGQLPFLLPSLKAPAYHALGNFNLPLWKVPGKKYVLTVHDLIPELLPHTVSNKFRWQFRAWLSHSLKLADQVVCVSETTRQDLLARYEFPQDKIQVIYNGVDHVQALPPPDEHTSSWLEGLRLPRPFVLYAGALDARKNVTLLVDALALLRRRGLSVPLVLMGQRWFGAGEIETKITQARALGLDIRPLGYLEDARFYALLRRASAFVFPSRYEGFGLPPLEAMSLGVPTLVSNAGALPEVCGEGAWVLPVDEAPAWADALEKVLTDEARADTWRRRGRDRAQGFSWARAAQQHKALYARL